jgi:hypothetical protein
MDLAAHVDALVAHTSPTLVDIVLANNRAADLPGGEGSGVSTGSVGGGVSGGSGGEAAPSAVKLRWPPSTLPLPRLIIDDVVNPSFAHHHDPAHLAAAVIRAFEAETGIRRRNAGRAHTRTA